MSVASGGFFAKGNITIKGPVTYHNYYGWGNLEGLSTAVWNPARYYGQLDLDRFTGRRELIAQINEFIATRSQGWVVIQGEAGVGKSALAAHLVSGNDWFHHFTWFTGARSPERARKNLASQLISVFRLNSRAPGGYLPPNAGEPKYLADVLADAAGKRDSEAAGQPIVLVIDTLSEMDSDGQSETPLGLPRADELPHKVFIIVTRRPAPPLRSVRQPILSLHIKVDEGHGSDTDKQLSVANTQDMREYLRKLLEGSNQDPELVGKLRRYDMPPKVFIDTLVNRCAGVWIYLKCVLYDIRDGGRAPTDVISLPQGLRIYYLLEIQRQQERDFDKWERFRLPALATLAALRRPATITELARLAGIGTTDVKELRSWLDKDIRALLHKDLKGDEYRYEIRHQSLRDLVAAPDPPRQSDDEDVDDDLSKELPNALRAAHAAITAALIPRERDWPDVDQYVRDMLAEHAASAGRLDELVDDPGFLLICQPSSVLFRRRYLKTSAGIRAVSAYEAALNEWAGLPPDDTERAWRLHVWARKTGASDLAVACGEIAGRRPVIQAAMWTGTTHRAIHAHDGSVGTLTVLPARDGRPLLASGGSDGRVRLWDPDTGAPQGDFLRDPDTRAPRGDPRPGHDDWVTAAAAVPLPDQQVVLATGANDGTVRLWNPQTRELLRDPAGHSGPVNAMAVVRLADDHTALATGGRNGMTIQRWDPSKKTLAGDPLIGCDEWVTAAAAVPTQGGQLLATGASDGTVRLWDPQTRKPVGDPLTGHIGPVNAMAVVRLADDHTALATGGRNGMTIQRWDLRSAKPIGDPLTSHNGPVNAITVARLADRTFFVTAGQGRTIRLWDAVTGTAVPLSLPVHARRVNAIAAVPLPDERTLLVTGGSDGKIELQELYESADGAPATVPSTGHLGVVNAIAFAELADRIVLVTGSRDRTVRLWDPDTGMSLRDAPLVSHSGPLSAVAAVPLPGGRTLLATSGIDGTVRMWDDPMASAPTARPLKRYAQVYAMASVELPDRALLATGGSDGTVRLWEPVTGNPVGTPLAGHAGPVNTITSVRLSDGHTLLASGGSDGTVRFWDPVTCMATGVPLIGYGGRIRAVAAVRLPDGHTLFASGGDFGVVQVWDGTDCKAVIEPSAGQAAAVNAIAAVELPGQTLLATGDDDGAVRLWDPETGEPAAGSLTSRLTGHDGAVKAIASMRLPSGHTLLATGGDDKTILIWTFG